MRLEEVPGMREHLNNLEAQTAQQQNRITEIEHASKNWEAKAERAQQLLSQVRGEDSFPMYAGLVFLSCR